METKDIIRELRAKHGLSQDELADKVFVTRQAVSRWETGETVPNTETLKLLSKQFDVTINTLLGSPLKLVCECCGMPLSDTDISHEKDGAFNEKYCKWCYSDGGFTMDFWKQYGETDGAAAKFEEFKRQLVSEFNILLYAQGLPKVDDLNVLSGDYINLGYRLPSGQTVKFLDDGASYLGNQLEGRDGRCYGIAANMDFLLVCTYEENGENPELVIYKKR
nr:helix-turn-helix domain-containing protein [Clostridia bacterium]